MSYLNNFYKDAVKAGFSKDYQIVLTSLNIGGLDFSQRLPLSYAKKIQIPVKKATALKDLSLYASIIPLFNGSSDYENKTNYQITFWAPVDAGPAIEAFNNATGNVADNNDIIQFNILDDQNKSIYTVELQKVTVKNISQVTYSTDGTGKPQEFTVTFTYEDVIYNPISKNSPDNIKIAGLAYGSTDDSDDKVPISVNTYSKFQSQKTANSALSNSKGGLLGVLQDVTSYSKAITSTVRALGNTAGSIRGAGRAIRGR